MEPASEEIATSQAPRNDSVLNLSKCHSGLFPTKSASKNFNSKKLTYALKSLEIEGHIDKLIDETKKNNPCWHLKIRPDKKSMSNHNKGSILLPVKFMNGGIRIC